VHDILASFCADADELLRQVSCQIDDVLLNEIASADYGHDVGEHLGYLRQIRDQGFLGRPMRWHPREVLELIRWLEPEDPDWKPGLTRERGHWMRAFACSSLLRAAGEPENEELRAGWNQTLIQLIESLRAVGPDFDRPTAAFLAWLISRIEPDYDTDELGFLMIGLLWYSSHVQAADDILIALSELTSAEVRRRPQVNVGRWSRRWLLGTTLYDLRHARWEQLGRSFIETDLRGRSSAATDWIRLIGNELAGT
jgi:hypothetical protein